MAELVWDKVGDRLWDTGLSKGVLYGYDGYGIPWNGLISIEEDGTNTVEPVHFDGWKFDDIVTIGDYSATLRAFTYPDEFQNYEGTLEDQTGFYITNQRQTRFGLSYQTLTGNDVSGIVGYKIHLLYNLTAIATQRSYKTLSLDVEPLEFEWALTAIPEEIEQFRPTAHVIFDSRELDPHLLSDLEEILYGSDTEEARLPTLKGLATFVRKWDRFIITDNGDGTWTAYEETDGELITMLDDTTFQIVSDTAVYLDADTYEISSSEKNQEDIWLP
jgi:hypothetical protein